MILFNSSSQIMSPSNGSMFHSEEKLKSLQWLTNPTRSALLLPLCPPHLQVPALPSDLHSSTPAALLCLKPVSYSPLLRLCFSCSCCKKQSSLGKFSFWAHSLTFLRSLLKYHPSENYFVPLFNNLLLHSPSISDTTKVTYSEITFLLNHLSYIALS